MKCIYIIISVVVFLCDFGVNNEQFYPNLPMGEYRVNFKTLLRCQKKSSDYLQINMYPNKKSASITEIKGNVTLFKPFDDSLTVHFNFAVKDSIGGWKDNAHIYQSEKACTTLKNIMGQQWIVSLKSHGLKHTDCPIPPGVYVNNRGYELSNITSNYPKIFFYGTYKLRVYFTDQHNNEHGCIFVIIEIKRPWETS